MEISLADVIKIGVIVGGWIITIVKIDGRLKSVEKDIKEVTQVGKWKERMDERMRYMRRDIEGLRRGRGFISKDLNGEYGEGGKAPEDTEED